MQVEKYRAKTIRDAVSRVKDILGPEAMIISTKKLRGNSENNFIEIAAAPARDDISPKKSSLLGEVKSELMSIKEMIYLLNQSGGIIEKLIWNPPILNLYAKLLRNGVRDDYARTFLKRTGALKEFPADPGDNITQRTINEIKRVIKVKDPFEARDQKRIIAAFIGTTGVGKSTTIAKLAAQLMLKARKKIGIMSIDNYRIGAMEQIKTYANILGIPCYPAFNRKDLLFALRRMEGRDVVLIDTAGQSQYDRSRLEELKKIMPVEFPITSHLLLSVATTEFEMNKTAVNFSPLEYQSYIFTKIDEAERRGSIINQIMKLRLPISYITAGQNVPGDIETASKGKILNLLLDRL